MESSKQIRNRHSQISELQSGAVAIAGMINLVWMMDQGASEVDRIEKIEMEVAIQIDLMIISKKHICFTLFRIISALLLRFNWNPHL